MEIHSSMKSSGLYLYIYLCSGDVHMKYRCLYGCVYTPCTPKRRNERRRLARTDDCTGLLVSKSTASVRHSPVTGRTVGSETGQPRPRRTRLDGKFTPSEQVALKRPVAQRRLPRREDDDSEGFGDGPSVDRRQAGDGFGGRVRVIKDAWRRRRPVVDGSLKTAPRGRGVVNDWDVSGGTESVTAASASKESAGLVRVGGGDMTLDGAADRGRDQDASDGPRDHE